MDRALGARVVSPQHGSCSRGLGCQEGGTDAFVTIFTDISCSLVVMSASLESCEIKDIILRVLSTPEQPSVPNDTS